MALIVEKKTGILDTLGNTQDTRPTKIKKEKIKKSFISTYFEELKDVAWPTWRQVLVWFAATLLVCVFFTYAIISFDHVFKALFKLVECSSPKGAGGSFNSCIQELPRNIFSGNI
jgi:preprotein translocase SecE subunit